MMCGNSGRLQKSLTVRDKNTDTATILIVGDIVRWKTLGRLQTDVAHCVFVNLDDVDPTSLRRIAPDLVLSPLVSDGFDAVDVAIRLMLADYSGRYRVVAEHMPDANIVRAEISAIAPGLDFDLLVLPRPANR